MISDSAKTKRPANRSNEDTMGRRRRKPTGDVECAAGLRCAQESRLMALEISDESNRAQGNSLQRDVASLTAQFHNLDSRMGRIEVTTGNVAKQVDNSATEITSLTKLVYNLDSRLNGASTQLKIIMTIGLGSLTAIIAAAIKIWSQ